MTSTLTRQVLLKYPGETFIETGTNDASGILVAISCGFKKIFSVEKDPTLGNKAKEMFLRIKNVAVNIFIDDSPKGLEIILPNITEKSVIWLDAHSDGSCPILEELDVIKKHSIKHTILIDDMRMFGRAEHEFITEEQIKSKIYEIDPAYKFRYEASVHGEKDILVAYM